jgi:hypothetical protein
MSMTILDTFAAKYRKIAKRAERLQVPIFVVAKAEDFTGILSIDEHLPGAIRAASQGQIQLFEACLQDARNAATTHKAKNRAAFEADLARREGKKA